MENLVTLSASQIALASESFKLELAGLLGLSPSMADAQQDDYEGYEQIELDTQAARVFVQGCGEKTLAVLHTIIELGNPFSLRQLEQRFGVGENGLRSVWSGLTKRSKTITGDASAYLVKFVWNDNASEEDYWGHLSEVTFASLAKVLD
jgi:hypothetical protein